VPLWYGQGLVYGLGAGAGGAYFLWKSWLLYIAPSKHTAMDNFFASFIQLGLMIFGVVLDALVGLA
jgi:protoheme IX farnesyltransferase